MHQAAAEWLRYESHVSWNFSLGLCYYSKWGISASTCFFQYIYLFVSAAWPVYNLVIALSTQFIWCSVDHDVHTFYSVTLSVALLTDPTLLVCLTHLASTFSLVKCLDYLLYFVFDFCLHSFMIYQTLCTYHLNLFHPGVAFLYLLKTSENL